MKSYARILSSLLTGVILLSACTPAATSIPTSAATFDVNPIYTAAAATIAVESTRNAALIPTATATATLEPSATATATLEPSPVDLTASGAMEITPTLWIPSSGDTRPTITANLDTNCRQGPDATFDIVGGLRVGDTSEVYGMLSNASWWYIKNPDKESPKYCWVWGSTTEVTGSTNSVPVMAVPPTPYKSLPDVSVNISVDPGSSSTCPQVVTVTGTITTSAEGTFSYQIYDDEGNIYKNSTMTFKDDGSDSISFSKTFKSDYSGWFMMKVTNPVTQKSNKGTISIDCP